MKIKFIEKCIMLMLADKGRYGYSLYKDFEEAGFDISMSNFYKKLKKLEEEGIIASKWDFDGRRPQKVYFLTSKGKKNLKSCKENLRKIFEKFSVNL